MIKAIETVYNGYRFRSRLEARWAVFFDALGIEYEYEPEGFELPSGNRYLPDFYLPDDDVWVEIKGSKPSSDDIGKMLEFCECKCDLLNNGARFRLLVGGIPTPMSGLEIAVSCYVYESPSVLKKAYRKEIESKTKLPLPDFVTLMVPEHGAFIPALWISGRAADRVSGSLIKARQARFEFGETP